VLMKKLILISSLILAVSLPLPVFGFNPPSQSSDNATDVVLWHGDNLTIQNISGELTLNVTGLQLSLSDIGNKIDTNTKSINSEIDNQMKKMGLFFLLCFIVILGFWRGDRVMLVIGGFGMAIYGFSLWTSYQWLSIIAVIAGVYLTIKAFNRIKEK
jgi:hypothetical protein